MAKYEHNVQNEISVFLEMKPESVVTLKEQEVLCGGDFFFNLLNKKH